MLTRVIRASPASGRFTNRPYVASSSRGERDGLLFMCMSWFLVDD